MRDDVTIMRLWYVRESEVAILYTTVPPERHPSDAEELWVPKSVIEHKTKRGIAHEVTIQDWWIRKNRL